MISEKELYILSYYWACELSGSLLYGKLALRTTIDEYRQPLTQHSMEEAKHSSLWAKVIKELGHTPLKVAQTYQKEYGKIIGIPKNILEIFCVTQVFEERVLDHYIKHLSLPGTHPIVKETLQRVIEDESGHIGWIETELNKYAEQNGQGALDKIMNKFRKVDEQIHENLSKTSPFKEYFKDIL
jgi:rubrerythrin